MDKEPGVKKAMAKKVGSKEAEVKKGSYVDLLENYYFLL